MAKQRTYSVLDLIDIIEYEGGIFEVLDKGLLDNKKIDHPKIRKLLEKLTEAYEEISPLLQKLNDAIEDAILEMERQDIDEEE